MQTILTKYIQPSSRTGAKIKAVQSGWNDKKECKTLTLSYDHALDSEQNHAKAALELAKKLDWHGKYTCGSLGAWSDFSFVFTMVPGSDLYILKKGE